jgi:hypothetical protein
MTMLLRLLFVGPLLAAAPGRAVDAADPRDTSGHGDGGPNDGSPNDGSPNDGSPNDGSADDGSPNDGSADDGGTAATDGAGRKDPAPEAPAAGPRDDAATSAAAAREEAPNHGVSARVLLGGVVEAGADASGIVGGGVAYEYDLSDADVAFEFAVEGLAGTGRSVGLGEVVVEKEVALSDGAGLYFGGGGIGALRSGRGGVVAGLGALAMVGVELEVAGGLEVFVELDGAVLVMGRAVEFETDVGTGVLYRF